MKCKNCPNETTGRSLYCSESCKTVYNRNKRNTKPEPEQQSGTVNKDLILALHELGKSSPKQIRALDPRCVQPQALWDGTLAGLSDRRLQDRLVPMKVWQDSQAYAEVCHRLTHEQEPKNKPCWLREQLNKAS